MSSISGRFRTLSIPLNKSALSLLRTKRMFRRTRRSPLAAPGEIVGGIIPTGYRGVKFYNSRRRNMPVKCPDCYAPHPDDRTCQDDFHKMLEWEFEDQRRGVVHHLTVLSYHLQHPGLYSPEGMAGARQLLVDLLERGRSPLEVRIQQRSMVSSTNRQWKIKGTAASHGSYDHPVRWTMTAADVVAGGPDHYCDNVKSWAGSILQALRSSHNL